MKKQAVITIEGSALGVRMEAGGKNSAVCYYASPEELDTDTRNELNQSSITVLVPTEDCLIKRLSLPVRSSKLLKTAVPFALEDELADDISNLHVAYALARDSLVNVVVVSKEKMGLWSDLLEAYGIKADKFIPDILSLPNTEEGLYIHLNDDLAKVRCDSFMGFSVEQGLLLSCLSSYRAELLEKEESIPFVSVSGNDQERVTDIISLLETEGWRANHFNSNDLDHKLLIPEAFNLLQHEYSVKRNVAGSKINWVIAAILICILGVLELSYLAWDNFTLKKQADEISAEMKDIFLSVNPKATKIVNPKAQLRNLINGQSATENRGFLDLLQSVANGFNELGAGEISRLSYQKGRLDLNVTFNTVAAVEELKQWLIARKMSLEILSLNSLEYGVEAYLRIGDRAK